jgi:hypothetical protein
MALLELAVAFLAKARELDHAKLRSFTLSASYQRLAKVDASEM